MIVLAPVLVFGVWAYWRTAMTPPGYLDDYQEPKDKYLESFKNGNNNESEFLMTKSTRLDTNTGS